jgi:hypothetical protein
MNFFGDGRPMPTITRRYATSNNGLMELNLPVKSLKFKNVEL